MKERPYFLINLVLFAIHFPSNRTRILSISSAKRCLFMHILTKNSASTFNNSNILSEKYRASISGRFFRRTQNLERLTFEGIPYFLIANITAIIKKITIFVFALFGVAPAFKHLTPHFAASNLKQGPTHSLPLWLFLDAVNQEISRFLKFPYELLNK